MQAYIVTYDIADPKRLRQVYDTMRGYGTWLQLSVFRWHSLTKLIAGRRGAHTSRVKQVLQTNRNSVKRPAVVARRDLGFRLARLFERKISRNGNRRV